MKTLRTTVSQSWGCQKSSYFTLHSIRAGSILNISMCTVIWLEVVTRSTRCAKEGGKREQERERRANFYLQLTKRRKANFNKLFELVAGISWDLQFKGGPAVIVLEWAQWQSIPKQGTDRKCIWTIQATSKAASNKGLKLERIVLGMETRAF